MSGTGNIFMIPDGKGGYKRAYNTAISINPNLCTKEEIQKYYDDKIDELCEVLVERDKRIDELKQTIKDLDSTIQVIRELSDNQNKLIDILRYRIKILEDECAHPVQFFIQEFSEEDKE